MQALLRPKADNILLGLSWLMTQTFFFLILQTKYRRVVQQTKIKMNAYPIRISKPTKSIIQSFMVFSQVIVSQISFSVIKNGEISFY